MGGEAFGSSGEEETRFDSLEGGGAAFEEELAHVCEGLSASEIQNLWVPWGAGSWVEADIDRARAQWPCPPFEMRWRLAERI